MGHRVQRIGFLAAFLLAVGALAQESAAPPVYREAPEDAPAASAARDDSSARSPGMRAQRGGFVSVQVNVDGAGQNIVGDAGNEPSISIDPLNPDNIVIGWRQFDSITSNFRQAGWAFSHDGGQSWTFPGVIDPGQFRSDPVLDTDSVGTFYYNSLTDDFSMDVFRSLDQGQSWPLTAEAFGGDKNWMVIDKTGGIGEGHVYGNWQRNFGCCGTNLFTRSTDGGVSFEFPVGVTNSPSFGTSAVGPDGTVYVSGVRDADLVNFAVSRSTNAQDSGASPTFTGVLVDMDGSMGFGGGPNPAGLQGQANVVVDSSGGPTHGNVYLMSSVNPSGIDPLDVHIARSEDGGANWSAPVRINDDPLAQGIYQWFGTLSVAPNGRLDAVWNDNRNSGQNNISELFYAYSWDAGDTWLGNQPVSPSFDSFVGWPQQDKLGDYYTMISDESGGNLAWAATFNGEQDVYFLRVFPDCNNNGVSDVDDIAGGTSSDTNGNNIPDECEGGGLLLAPPVPGLPGQSNTLVASGAGAGNRVAFLRSSSAGSSPAPGCPGVSLGIASPVRMGIGTADAGGSASVDTTIPGGAAGRTVLFQAYDRNTCVVSNVVSFSFPSFR
jgi:hypothetical protein